MSEDVIKKRGIFPILLGIAIFILGGYLIIEKVTKLMTWNISSFHPGNDRLSSIFEQLFGPFYNHVIGLIAGIFFLIVGLRFIFFKKD